MSILQAFVLGVLQGLTEFLPVSSSGHLVLARWLLGWDAGSTSLEQAFDVAVHVGTLVGASAFLRRDLARLARALGTSISRRSAARPEDRLPWLLALGSLPAAATGALLESTVTERSDAPWLVGVMLIIGGLLLWAADHRPAPRGFEHLTPRDATLIGVAQAIALQPGVSRSGATITAARALGYDRDGAARFSFLLSLPLIAGAGVFELMRLSTAGLAPGFGAALAVGAGTAAATSVVAVWSVLAVVRRRSFLPFVVYRVALGLAVVGLVLSPWR